MVSVLTFLQWLVKATGYKKSNQPNPETLKTENGIIAYALGEFIKMDFAAPNTAMVL